MPRRPFEYASNILFAFVETLHHILLVVTPGSSDVDDNLLPWNTHGLVETSSHLGQKIFYISYVIYNTQGIDGGFRHSKR